MPRYSPAKRWKAVTIPQSLAKTLSPNTLQRKSGRGWRTATLPVGIKPPRFTSLSAARKGYTQPNPLGFFHLCAGARFKKSSYIRRYIVN